MGTEIVRRKRNDIARYGVVVSGSSTINLRPAPVLDALRTGG
jgi:hypothetical protein